MLHPRFKTAAVAAGLLGAALAVTPGPAALAAQTKPAAFPAPPAVPTRIPFSDEVAGRRLLYAARDAYRAAPSLRFLPKHRLEERERLRLASWQKTG